MTAQLNHTIVYSSDRTKSARFLAALLGRLRAFLLVTNFIGLDLMIFFFAIQLRYLQPAVFSFPRRMRAFPCVASYTALRVTTRMIGLLLAPAGRVTAGLTTWLFVLSRNLWCPKLKQGLTAI